MNTSAPSFDDYARWVAANLDGSRLVSAHALAGGVSAEMRRLVLETPQGAQEIVVRMQRDNEWKGGEASVSAKEFNLLRALHRKGLKVPAILHLDVTGAILPAPCYAMELVPGSSTVRDEALESALEQMAEFLRQLHELDGEDQDLPLLEDPRTEVFQYLPDPDAARLVREVVENSPGDAPANPPRLLHGDFWPGNVLWHEDRLAAVVDWEDAALGDPLADLAAARVELLCQYDEQAMELFTSRYLSGSDVDVSDLPLWEIYVSASALATMKHWGLAPDEEAKRRKATEGFLQRALSDLATP
ncbi:MAG: phosphotransferase [Acidobacteriota bacterium]